MAPPKRPAKPARGARQVADDDTGTLDAGAITKRLTNTWEVHTKLAEQLATELDAAERDVRATRPDRAAFLRGLRLSLRYFVDRFGQWTTDKSIAFEDKSRDLQEFQIVRDAVMALLNLPATPTPKAT
jgi:hypothetical protein